jgi:hypothetical protein
MWKKEGEKKHKKNKNLNRIDEYFGFITLFSYTSKWPTAFITMKRKTREKMKKLNI